MAKDDDDDLFSFMHQPTARDLRDGGIELTLEAEHEAWKAAALLYIESLPSGWVGTSEEIKVPVEDRIGKPHHWNVWGGIIMTARRQGILIPTGHHTKGRLPASHARAMPIYRRK